jgi:hypothetical protein
MHDEVLAVRLYSYSGVACCRKYKPSGDGLNTTGADDISLLLAALITEAFSARRQARPLAPTAGKCCQLPEILLHGAIPVKFVLERRALDDATTEQRIFGSTLSGEHPVYGTCFS